MEPPSSGQFVAPSVVDRPDPLVERFVSAVEWSSGQRGGRGADGGEDDDGGRGRTLTLSARVGDRRAAEIEGDLGGWMYRGCTHSHRV